MPLAYRTQGSPTWITQPRRSGRAQAEVSLSSARDARFASSSYSCGLVRTDTLRQLEQAELAPCYPLIRGHVDLLTGVRWRVATPAVAPQERRGHAPPKAERSQNLSGQYRLRTVSSHCNTASPIVWTAIGWWSDHTRTAKTCDLKPAPALLLRKDFYRGRGGGRPVNRNNEMNAFLISRCHHNIPFAPRMPSRPVND